MEIAQSNVPIWRVGEFTSHVKHHIEQGFSRVRIRGELQGVLYHRSGHLYAQLREDNVVVDVVCWRQKVPFLGLTAEDGMEVVVTGKLTVYGGRSRYQVLAEKLELAGEGALLKMLQERRERLSKEGLFASSRKQKLPLLPERVGVITSPMSAAMFDIARRARDRLGVHLLIWPATMQGTRASEEVILGLQGLQDARMGMLAVDVILIARGGGSLEDLLPFSDENLVRAVAESRLPVVSAIGHESDVCLLDEVADLRAATPTAGVEAVVPERRALQTKILLLDQKQKNQMEATLRTKEYQYMGIKAMLLARGKQFLTIEKHVLHRAEKVSHLVFQRWILAQKRWNTTSIQTPRETLLQKNASLSVWVYRLQDEWKENWHSLQRVFLGIDGLWTRLRPQSQLATRRLEEASDRLQKISTRRQFGFAQRVQQATRLLENFDEKVILRRGFVLVRDRADRVMTNPQQILRVGRIQLQFAEEKLQASIVKFQPKKKLLSQPLSLFSSQEDGMKESAKNDARILPHDE